MIKGYAGYLIPILPAAAITLIGYYVALRKLGGLTSNDLNEMSPKLRSLMSKADRYLKIKD